MRKFLGVLAVAGLAVAACGGGSAGEESGTSNGADNGGGRIELQDATGTVYLDEPADDVVALEWSYVEDLLALGVTPVGVADIEGYHTWVTAGDRVPEDVVDVGTRQEPSIEQIRTLEPDLIITDVDRGNLDQLREIAPVLAFNLYDDSATQLENMRSAFTTIAAAVGREDEATAVLEQLDQTIEDVRGRLEDAGLSGARYAIAQGFTYENVPTMRLFTDEALVAQVLNEAGLVNAWTGEPDDYGMTTVGVEALTQVSDANFLYVAQNEDNIYTGALADNPVWTNLDFVRENRVYPLDPGTWFFGGPLSCVQLLEETAAALGA